MMKKFLLRAALLSATLFLFCHAGRASATLSYFTNNCQECHSVSTCAGCHAHGVHSGSAKNDLNLKAATDKTSYQPGETVSVRITGGYRSGWVRAILYDGDPAAGGVELARSTGPEGRGEGQSLPITLTAPAPSNPGTYTFSASWYGNQYDKSGGYFGPRWRPDPTNDGHGEEIVSTNSFTVEGIAPPPPPAAAITVTDSVAPASDLQVPFGSVYTGSSATQTVTVTNTGNAALAVGSVGSANPLAAPFSVTNDTCSNQSITPAASCMLTIAFAPVSTGTFTNSFSIPSNDPSKSTVTVNVSGSGNAAPTAAITVTDSVAPSSDLQVPFGSVYMGSSATQTVTVRNDGNADLTIGSVGSANPLAAPFSVTNDTCSNQSITPAASCTLKIAFAPVSTGTFTDSFSIPSNDPSKSTVTVNVSGSGNAAPTAAITVTDSVAPASDLQVPFGNVYTGSSATQSVTVKNDGNADLTIGSVGSANPLASPFSVTNDTCSNQSITPAASCTLTIAFAPVSTGTFTDSFSIPSNDPSKSTVTVNVSGSGGTEPVTDITVTDSVAPATDLQVPFGSVSTGSSATQTVTVRNDGNSNLVIGSVGAANPLAAPFSITADSCSNRTIEPASSCTMTVEFTPTLEGPASDSFNIPSNDPDESSVTVSVNGSGSVVAVGDISVTDQVAPGDDLQVPFGDVREGMQVDNVVTVSNNSAGSLVIGSVGSLNPLSAPFSILSDGCSGTILSQNETCTISLRFWPPAGCAAVGTSCTYSDSFDIPSDDPDEPVVTVQVSGAGIAASGNHPPSKCRLKYPAHGQRDLPTSIWMRWEAASDPDGDHIHYEVRYSRYDDFHDYRIVGLPSAGKTAATLFAGTGVGFVFLGFIFAGTVRGRKGLLIAVALLILVGSAIIGCGVSKIDPPPATDVSRQVSGLETTTTYYWKVVADDGNGGVTESDVSTFSTQ